MSFIQNLFTSRDNNANSATYVGQQDRLWWDPVTNRFYYSDGQTPGGFPVGGGGNTVTNKLVNGAYELVLDATGNVTAPGAISAVGNITANYFVGNGSQLSSITGANVTGQVGNALIATTAIVAATVSANAQPNITSVGVLTEVSVAGNTTTGNLLTAGQVSATGTVTAGNITTSGASGNITGANVISATTFSATGNITANYFIGDGSQLTNLPSSGSNITIQNQGNTLTTAANTINFTGNGVSSTNVGNVVTVNITAGSGSGLPPQTGNVGKILSTDGVNPLWEYMPGVFGLVIDGGDAAFASLDFIIDGGPA